MAAPLRNEFWRARSSHGRKPTFLTAEALEAACMEYFQWVEDNPLQEALAWQGRLSEEPAPKMRAMTLAGLSNFLDINQTTWVAQRSRGEDFLRVVERVEALIFQQKMEGAAAGLLNSSIIARELGLADRTEAKVTLSHEQALQELADHR